MTAKRFEVHKVIGSFHEWSIEDNLNDKVVFGCIMHKYEADRLCKVLNELHEEYEELKLSNINLESKVIHLLDILQEKGSMTYEEVHEWWNSDVMMND